MKTIKFNIVIVIFSTFLFSCLIETVQIEKRLNTNEITEKEMKWIKGGLPNIRFLLRDRSKNEWISLSRDDPVPKNTWVPGGSVKLIIHGYSFKDYMTWEEKLNEQGVLGLGIDYSLQNSTINVFVLNWTSLSSEPLPRYFESAKATKFVGHHVAEFLVKLSKEGLIKDWDNVHIMGFSLGGHTGGAAGAKVQELTGGAKIGRITGLDPAGPTFDVKGKLPVDVSGFLEKSDGKFVDIIHCNFKRPGKSIIGHLGSFVECGHADFYPDGGESQSKCTVTKDRSTVPCSHFKCVEYMAHSLKSKLLACPCEDWETFKQGKCDCDESTGGVYMGDPCPTSALGRYFIKIS